MMSVVAVCLGFCGVVLFTFLLRSGQINGTIFGVLVSVVLVVSYALGRGEAVTEIDVKALKVTLKQVEQAKSDVFAKAEAVQRLAEQVGRFAAWNVSTANRWAVDDAKQMITQREQIAEMLGQVGTTPERIQEIVEPINAMVDRDLRAALWQDVLPQIHALINREGANVRVDPEPIRIVLIEKYDRVELMRLLQANRIVVAGIDARLNTIDNFRKTKAL